MSHVGRVDHLSLKDEGQYTGLCFLNSGVCPLFQSLIVTVWS